MKFDLIPIPEHLREHIECIRTTEYTGNERLAINVCLNGLPGIVFQHHNGNTPIECISTRSGRSTHIPTVYVYGQMTEPSIMNYRHESFITTQIVLKPHGLQTFFGINASILTNTLVELNAFSSDDLNMQLLEANGDQEHIRLLTNFLSVRLRQMNVTDTLVQEGLRLIHKNMGMITVKHLLNTLSISERQFERRFNQTVGLTPQFYIRVKRFNAAIRLMKKGQFERLGDIVYALNFYDQSHFIRDIKAFSGITPKFLSQKVTDFHLEQSVFAYLET
ncbi:MAG: hypothetical protein GFH27_549303n117 [Chloroflexi bacterium AL-W]|nr:hypothetical protein [Chloroflexi bacterium AL-N1]NOK68002.1 hypothetical protein [Chloroflexi bacterium AL-N10]NOK73342.1 hypothetical protein [Chloroflexi bacterium AL-N5]NOK83256.1 hypothetical protein [Chloroflexi bacterium AL-W]NOK87673.1 hypothetical protein [Chloroflexi bacterium AL-N15]